MAVAEPVEIQEEDVHEAGLSASRNPVPIPKLMDPDTGNADPIMMVHAGCPDSESDGTQDDEWW